MTEKRNLFNHVTHLGATQLVQRQCSNQDVPNRNGALKSMQMRPLGRTRMLWAKQTLRKWYIEKKNWRGHQYGLQFPQATLQTINHMWNHVEPHDCCFHMRVTLSQTIASTFRELDHKQFAKMETPFTSIPDQSLMIANKTQEIKTFLSLRLVGDE